TQRLSGQHLRGPDVALTLLEREVEAVTARREASPAELGRRIIEPHPLARWATGDRHRPEALFAAGVVSLEIHEAAVRRPDKVLEGPLWQRVRRLDENSWLSPARRDQLDCATLDVGDEAALWRPGVAVRKSDRDVGLHFGRRAPPPVPPRHDVQRVLPALIRGERDLLAI